MTDSLAFHGSSYSKEAFLRSPILSIDTINSLKQQYLNYPKKKTSNRSPKCIFPEK